MTQKEALDILKTGANVYLTGAAGSGKTYVLNAYIDYLKKNGVDVGITASTGIAATHMGGVTIHSWTGLGIRDKLSDYELEDMESKKYLWDRFQAAKVLVIDEVSMLHHYRLDLVDKICKAFKRNSEPFGGMQVVLCGDFFQLPPVARQGEPEPHFIYKSDAWRDMGLKVCYLEEQHRQTDDASLVVLNAIRQNDVTEGIYEHLKSRYNAALPEGYVPTKLYTHNIDVDRINADELVKISAQDHVYQMRFRGRPALVEALKKSCLAPERLVLRKGARVMFVKNNFDAGYVNGTLGMIEDFDEYGVPIVKTLKGDLILAEEASWSVEEDGKVKAELVQLPLRLAWAITVHKSQGMSLDAVEVDLSKSFVAGMGYVALSRVRTLGGLRLLGFNHQALQINEEVLEFDAELQKLSREEQGNLVLISNADLKELHDGFVGRNGGPIKKKKEKTPTHEVTRALIVEKLSLVEMAERREMTEDTILSHIEKLKSLGTMPDIGHLKPHSSLLEKIQKAFAKAGDGRLSSAKNILGSGVSYTNIKLARLFLDD